MLEGIIVECNAENLAGIGPVQAKRVDIHYTPEVQVEGPEQLLPFTMLTYSCSTTNTQQEARITWTVNDQDGQSVDFTELETGDLTSVIELYAADGYDQLVVGCLASNNAGEGYAEVEAYAVESPKTVQVQAPDQTEAGPEITYECVSPLSSPQQSIRWEVTNQHGEALAFHTEDPVVIDGYVTSLLFVTAQPIDRMLNVKCVASNYIGYVEDLSQEYLTYGAESVHLTGPSSVLASEQVVFSCLSDVSFPAPTLMWSLDGQDVTRDAQQTDNVEDAGGIISTSLLKLEPTMGGHEHVVECSVDGSDVVTQAKLTVEEVYGEELYVDQEYEEDLNEEGREEEYNYEEENYSYDEEEDYGDADSQYDIKETPDAVKHEYEDGKEYNDKEEAAPATEQIKSENEAEYSDKEDYSEDENEEYDGEEEDYDYESYGAVDEEQYTPEQIKSANEAEYSYKQDYSEDENEEYDGEEDDDDYESFGAVDEEKYSDEDKEFNQNENAVVPENPNYDEEDEEEDATDSQAKKAISEELFDTKKQEQSFSAAEPGSAVLSHESDQNKHVSADLFSPKSLYSSSEKIWSVNICFSVFLYSISRLLS